MVELYLHSHMYLLGMVLNYLMTGTSLTLRYTITNLILVYLLLAETRVCTYYFATFETNIQSKRQSSWKPKHSVDHILYLGVQNGCVGRTRKSRIQCSHASKLKQIKMYKLISHTILNDCNCLQFSEFPLPVLTQWPDMQGVFQHLTLYSLYNFTERNCIIFFIFIFIFFLYFFFFFLQIVQQKRGKLVVALATLNWITGWRHMRWIRKWLFSKCSHLGGSCVAVRVFCSWCTIERHYLPIY
jgi:hypothetical protein